MFHSLQTKPNIVIAVFETYFLYIRPTSYDQTNDMSVSLKTTKYMPIITNKLPFKIKCIFVSGIFYNGVGRILLIDQTVQTVGSLFVKHYLF